MSNDKLENNNKNRKTNKNVYQTKPNGCCIYTQSCYTLHGKNVNKYIGYHDNVS